MADETLTSPRTGAHPAAATAAPSAGNSLTLTDLRKTYMTRGRPTFEAVKGIDMQIEPGELVALLGPSGCGKTTTLRMIAGLETVTGGDIRIGDRSIRDLPPGKRDVGVGFESYALYPPLNIRENLAYGLKARKVPDADARVDALAQRLEMTELLKLRPAGLSSGQKQRVALARALIRNPKVLVLDEPLSHLDASARQRVRRELKVLQREFGYTTIVVTHDQLEALSLADRLAVMDQGIIQQFGTPDEVFDDPANQFVADFVGEPKINLVEGVVERSGSGTTVRIGDGSVLQSRATTATPGATVMVGIRPQDCRAAEADAPGLHGEALVVEDLQEFTLVTLAVPGLPAPVVAQLPSGSPVGPGDRIGFSAAADRVYLFDQKDGTRIR
ncbi:ABC transporter ATP-binding protein [Nakamurella flavida]|uniref:ABC transporter ATP-binding protein n=1 Tax=Nakamurella flavida TaxID=363630 RepID=A0A938YIU8_9ACTN|nr:ABC transporter ATP-binding protein [Nakamurella flavida]MBM9476767.1 ABC transporter ATP-binding protein [Nakamurella flavida]MDP9778795.1 multiple sugar transport system ATP-binding protein [Nakamurella flavida]